MKVIVQEEWFSVPQCGDNLDKLYVFGDNLQGVGSGGQAQIRFCINSIGLPTKRAPRMDEGSFFGDRSDEFAAVDRALDAVVANYERYHFSALVLPADGFGTGLARMDEYSPKLYAYMNAQLNERFGTSYEVPDTTD